MKTALPYICDFCGDEFAPHRLDQRFCGSLCRVRNWEAEHPRISSEASQRTSTGRRRASRDGRGTRIYLTAAEAVALSFGDTPETVTAKAERAIRRLPSPRPMAGQTTIFEGGDP